MPAILNRNALGVFFRILAATFGGYLLSMIACMWLASSLEMSVRDERILNNMLFFVFYGLVVIWAFMPRSHAVATLGIAVMTALPWLIWFLTGSLVA